MTYGDEKLVKNEIDKLQNLDIVNLFSELILIYTKIKENQKLMKECKSDFCYWGYVAKYEELEAIKEYIDNKMVDFLKESDSKRINSLLKTEENLKKIYKNKYKKIKGLKEYQPAHYKKKIELIESIFNYSENSNSK